MQNANDGNVLEQEYGHILEGTDPAFPLVLPGKAVELQAALNLCLRALC